MTVLLFDKYLINLKNVAFFERKNKVFKYARVYSF